MLMHYSMYAIEMLHFLFTSYVIAVILFLKHQFF